MQSLERLACQRKTLSACAVTSLVIFVGLLILVVIYPTLSRQDIVGEQSAQDTANHLNDDCRSEATVVSDTATLQKWETNFSQAWSNAEEKARQPAHAYMEKYHSIAVYTYTQAMLQPVKEDFKAAERADKQLKESSESLYFYLSEAIQVLKHSQVTCLSTNYRTESLLNLSASDKLIRFSTFLLGSDVWNLTGNASCFEIYTCFGADITHYSALKQKHQVLIPPYEVFKVRNSRIDAQSCKIIYRLKSNLNCVYDTDSDALHPISASPVEGVWLILTITCMIIVSLSLPFVIMKVLENQKKTSVYRAAPLHNKAAVII